MDTSMNLLFKISVVSLLVFGAQSATLLQRSPDSRNELLKLNLHENAPNFLDAAADGKEWVDLTAFLKLRNADNLVEPLADGADSTSETDDPSSGSTDIDGSTDVPGSDKPTDSPSNPSTDNDLSGGAIAGIVIGSIAGVCLIAGGVYYLYREKKLCFE